MDTMRQVQRILTLAILLVSWLARPSATAAAAYLDMTADRVFGQPDFTSNVENNGGISANSLGYPHGIVVDAAGNLYVADTTNHRVLEYDAPLTGDKIADRVFGQPDFTSNKANNGGVSANSLNFPEGLALDAAGNLYIVDGWNHRVLEYDNPLMGDTTADRVFGQPDFISNDENNGGVSASSLWYPEGVALDTSGNLYVADWANSRVLEYDSPLTSDTTADRVFGQPDLTSNSANNGGVSANSLNYPFDVALDGADNLYVVDTWNHRALEYDTPLTGDTTADRVFGQSDFTTNTENNGGISADSLWYPEGVGLDTAGNLYVADLENNRVLEFDAPLVGDTTADWVYGQPDFTSNAVNNGGVSANSLYFPEGIALDKRGNLYVTDPGNHRVLEYDGVRWKSFFPYTWR